jgi:hypothetical protein
MSFGAFLWGWLTRSFGRTLDIAHNVRRALDILVAWLVARGVVTAREGEPAVVTATYLVLAALVLLGTLAWYAHALYRDEHTARVRAEERLRPVLEIRGVEPVRVGDDHRRVMVHNLSAGRVRFRARLVEIRSSPPVGYALPVPLRPTHGEAHGETEGEVPGGEDQPVDVFADPGPPHALRLLVMGQPPVPLDVPRNRRYELRICVYPAADGAVSACRWFYIVPQPDGGVIFTPAGANEAVNPAAPAAG